MNFAHIVNSAVEAYPLSRAAIAAIIADADPDVDVGLPANLEGADLSEWGILPVEPTEAPTPGEGEILEEGPPIGPPWQQTWVVRAMTPEELAAMVPSVVSIRQARLALNAAGLLEAVDAAVAGLSTEAKIEWEWATEVRRDHPLIETLGGALELDEAAIDALFIAAGNIT